MSKTFVSYVEEMSAEAELKLGCTSVWYQREPQDGAKHLMKTEAGIKRNITSLKNISARTKTLKHI